MTREPVCIVDKLKIHSAEYTFIIVDGGAEFEGFLLSVGSLDTVLQKRIEGTFQHRDLDHVKQVRDAVIEVEKKEEFFIALAGERLFRNMSHKILPPKKPKKEKVFSMRFDRELKARFAEKCERSGRSQSEAMRILMEYYLSYGIPALREPWNEIEA